MVSHRKQEKARRKKNLIAMFFCKIWYLYAHVLGGRDYAEKFAFLGWWPIWNMLFCYIKEKKLVVSTPDQTIQFSESDILFISWVLFGSWTDKYWSNHTKSSRIKNLGSCILLKSTAWLHRVRVPNCILLKVYHVDVSKLLLICPN